MAIGQNIHQPPPAPVPQTNSQTWVHPPNTFDGSNLEDLRTFLLQCQIMFNSYPQQYSSHTAKVCFAISYLKKAALEWFKQGIIEDDPRLVPAWKLSWPEFINELRTYFGPANPTGVAKLELRHLTVPNWQSIWYASTHWHQEWCGAKQPYASNSMMASPTTSKTA